MTEPKHSQQLAVFGCSYADYLPRNKTVWGRELAHLLNCEYLHQGAGAGSNWRIWRELGTRVITGDIVPEDIVVVQYTGLERREFWSAKSALNPNLPPAHNNRDPWPTGGDLLRYKASAWQWQDHRVENAMFKSYEQNFVNLHYEHTWFDLQHLQLQLLLREHHIRCVFLNARMTPVRPLSLIAPFDRSHWFEPVEFDQRTDVQYEPGDHTHFSDQGHRELAQLLYQHMITLGWSG